MAKTSHLILLMDLVVKTPISPITNIDGIYYEETVNGAIQRISLSKNLPVKYTESKVNADSGNVNSVTVSLSDEISDLNSAISMTFDVNKILSNINVANFVLNNFKEKYNEVSLEAYDAATEEERANMIISNSVIYKKAARTDPFKYEISEILCQETPNSARSELQMSHIIKEFIENTGVDSSKLFQLTNVNYNLSTILTKTLNSNNTHIVNILSKTVDTIDANLINVYNAIQLERQITHTYYDCISNILNGNYKESDLDWGYTLADGHGLNDNEVEITDPYNSTLHLTLNLNGHVNNELDPIAGVLDSTTISNIFNGYGLKFTNADFAPYPSQSIPDVYNKNIFKLLNTEYEDGFASNIWIKQPVINQLKGSVIYKILIKITCEGNHTLKILLPGANVTPGVSTPSLVPDIIVKNGWNTIPINKYVLNNSESLYFSIDTGVTIHAIHIFGEKSYTGSVDNTIKKSVNINKLFDKYNDNFDLTLPGALNIDAFSTVGYSDDASTINNINDNVFDGLILGNYEKTHLTLSRKGYIRAFNGNNYSTLYLNTANDLIHGANVILGGSSNKVIVNGTLNCYNGIVNESLTRTNKLHTKYGFYLSSNGSDYSNNTGVNVYTGNQPQGSIEIASTQNTNGDILGLRVNGGAGSVNQLIQINVGNTSTTTTPTQDSSRDPGLAKASIELNANTQTIEMRPRVFINGTNNGTLAELKVGTDITLAQGNINANNGNFTSNVIAENVQCNRIIPKNNGSDIYISGNIHTNNLVCSQISVDSNESTFIRVNGQLKTRVNNVPDVSMGVPIGAIMMWGSNNPPAGWLLCNGADLNRSAYQKLFNVIGTTYGSSNTTSFKLPDLRQRFPLGAKSETAWICGRTAYNTNLGNYGGEKFIKLNAQESGLPNRTMTEMTLSVGINKNISIEKKGINIAGSYNVVTGVDVSANANYNKNYVNAHDAELAHNNIPPFVTVNFIIKYE